MWGIVALVAGGIALLGANVSALVPDSFFSGLHSSRALDRDAAALHAQIAQLSDTRNEILKLAALQQQAQTVNDRLAQRFDGLVESAGAVRERVGALEGALPKLVRTLPIQPGIDASVITGSIDNPQPGFSPAQPAPPHSAVLPADGGSVRVTHSPLLPDAAPVQAIAVPQPLPQALAMAAPDKVALSPKAATQWEEAPVPRVSPAPIPAVRTASTDEPDSTDRAATDDGDPVARIADLPVVNSLARGVRAPRPRPGNAPSHKVVVPLASPRTASAAPTMPAAAPTMAAAAAGPVPPADVKAIGIAIGGPVQPASALPAWQALASKVGLQLVGTSPLLADDPAGGKGKVLVAGPIGSIAVATQLCSEIDRAGLTCTPMPYVGSELTAAAR
jgi:hypothetical protein